MATKSHSRPAYSILLLQKLLSLRDGVSPLTLVLDSVQEPGTVLVEEFMLRAKAAGSRIVYVSSYLAGPRRSPHVDVVIERRRMSLEALRDAITAACQAGQKAQKTLVVVDSLCQIAQREPLFVAAFVSSLVSPTASVLGLYHADDDRQDDTIHHSSSTTRLGLGKPSPLTVLCHLATALVRVHPLHAEVARKRARDRAAAEPRFGWTAGEGGLFGYSDHRYRPQDLVPPSLAAGALVDMELRRRSGRAVVERFVLVWGGDKPPQSVMPWDPGATPCADITVMADHPLFAAPPDPGDRAAAAGDDGHDADEMPETTFSLGLTDKQRRDREGIVLPYFDAQTDIGSGEGGRILYDMGREDDFDDEEDEI